MFGLWFVYLSRSRRLSFSCAGVVLAALALERFLVRNGWRWFSNAAKRFVHPGERDGRECVGGCHAGKVPAGSDSKDRRTVNEPLDVKLRGGWEV